MKQKFLVTITDLLVSLYEKHRGTHLPFDIDAHTDRLDVAKAIVRGIASDYDLQLAMGYAESQNIPEVGEWAQEIINANHVYVMGRIGISNMHKALTSQLEAVPDENVVQAGQALFAQTNEQLMQLAGDNPEIKEWLSTEIKSIAISLGLVEAEVEDTEVLNLDDPLVVQARENAQELAEELDGSE